MYNIQFLLILDRNVYKIYTSVFNCPKGREFLNKSNMRHKQEETAYKPNRYFNYDKHLPYLDMLVINGNDFLAHTNEDKDVMVAVRILPKEKGEPWQTAVYWFGEKTVCQEGRRYKTFKEARNGAFDFAYSFIKGRPHVLAIGKKRIPISSADGFFPSHFLTRDFKEQMSQTDYPLPAPTYR